MINSRVPTDRKRMTLAHELGHIVMHSEPIHLSKQSEEEAMRFAAEFLMPAHLIRPSSDNAPWGTSPTSNANGWYP